MKRTLITSIQKYIGQSVRVEGFVQTIRKQGGITFLVMRDRTGTVQGVCFKQQEAVAKTIEELTVESVISVVGLVKEQSQAPGGIEITVQELKVLSSAAELPIPITAEKGNEAAVQHRLDWRWLDLRDPQKAKIFRVWTALEQGFREYFSQQHYTQLYTPALMSAPSESGAEVFTVDYFERKAYLAQSPQFYKQMGMAAGLEKVFMVGPVFRAEQSFTTRHMTEFTGWDFELSYIDSHYDVMAEEERLLVAGFSAVQKHSGLPISIPTIPFPKLTMAEAKERLKEAGIKSEKPGDLSPEEERTIAQLVKEETGHDFVFITDYPIEVRPFYHMRHGQKGELTKSFDLLYQGIEITTGAQREHRVELLEKQALEKGMSLDLLQGYLSFFRYGCPPHGGVGIGPARIVMKLLDLPSVKEATFLPRDVKRITP